MGRVYRRNRSDIRDIPKDSQRETPDPVTWEDTDPIDAPPQTVPPSGSGGGAAKHTLVVLNSANPQSGTAVTTKSGRVVKPNPKFKDFV
jgi:hypothetical protein